MTETSELSGPEFLITMCQEMRTATPVSIPIPGAMWLKDVTFPSGHKEVLLIDKEYLAHFLTEAEAMAQDVLNEEITPDPPCPKCGSFAEECCLEVSRGEG